MKTTVSHSEVESYLRCERQHFYGYGMEIQRAATSDALARGTFGHSIAEVFFTELMEGVEFDTAVANVYLNIMTSTVSGAIKAEVTLNYQKFFEVYPFKGWRFLAVEKEFVLRIDDALQMPFVVDLVAMSPDGLYYAIDHKFVYDFVSERDAELMPQLLKYVGGMRALGFEVDRVAYSSFRTREIKDTDPNKKYQLTEFPINETRVKRTMTEQIMASRRVQAIKSLPLAEQSNMALRTANKMVCNTCSFRTLCVAELRDDSPNLILQSEYEPKKRRDFEVTPKETK